VNHNVDVGPGGDAHSVDRALEVLAAGGLPHEVVVTHEYPLVAVRDAVTAATDERASRAIKVVFRPDHP
jgi:threonine dehydrogenase-like Zn-dependent dehydrogenase